MYAFVIASPVRLCLQIKLPSLFTTGFTEKYRPLSRISKPLKTALAVGTFIMAINLLKALLKLFVATVT